MRREGSGRTPLNQQGVEIDPSDIPLNRIPQSQVQNAQGLTRSVSWQVLVPESTESYRIPPETHIQLALASGRTQLANERTFLAWIRTTASLLVLGIAIDRLADQNSQIASIGFIICAVSGALFSGYRYYKVRRDVRKAYPMEIVSASHVSWFLLLVVLCLFALVVSTFMSGESLFFRKMNAIAEILAATSPNTTIRLHSSSDAIM